MHSSTFDKKSVINNSSNSSKLEFSNSNTNKTQLSSRNSAPTKQYKYWMDVQDLLTLMRFLLKYHSKLNDRNSGSEEIKCSNDNHEGSSH